MVEAALVSGGDVDVVLDGERQSAGAALLASAGAGHAQAPSASSSRLYESPHLSSWASVVMSHVLPWNDTR